MPPNNFEKNKNSKPQGEDWEEDRKSYSEKKNEPDKKAYKAARSNKRNSSESDGQASSSQAAPTERYPNQHKIEELEDKMLEIPISKETNEFDPLEGLQEMRTLTDAVVAHATEKTPKKGEKPAGQEAIDLQRMAAELEAMIEQQEETKRADTEADNNPVEPSIDTADSSQEGEPVLSTEESEEAEQVKVEAGESEEVVEGTVKKEGIDKTEYFRFKQEFKAAEKEYYAAISEEYKARGVARGLFNKATGSRTEHQADIIQKTEAVQKTKDAFIAANRAYHTYSKESGIHDELKKKLQDRKLANATTIARNKIKVRLAAERGVTPDKIDNDEIDDSELEINPSAREEVSVKLPIAKRHLHNYGEKRNQLQTLQLPQKLAQLKNNVLEKISSSSTTAKAVGRLFTSGVDLAKRKIKENPKSAMALGGVTAVAAAGIGVFNAPAMAVGITAGLISRFVTQKGFVERYEDENESAANSTADQIEQGGEIDFDKLDAEYAPTAKSVYKARRTANAISIAAGAIAGGGTRVYGEDIVDFVSDFFSKDNADTPDYTSRKAPIKPLPPLKLEVDAESLGVSLEAPAAIGEADENIAKAQAEVDAPREEIHRGALENAEVATPSSVASESLSVRETISESMQSAFEKVPAMEQVIDGDTVSQMLETRLKELVAEGLVLPEGLNMYNTFPEFFNRGAENPGFTPQEWEALGVKSTNPSLIFPKEEIDMNAVVARMLEIHLDKNPGLTLVTPETVLGTENMAMPTDASVEGVTTVGAEVVVAPERTATTDGVLADVTAANDTNVTAEAVSSGAEGPSGVVGAVDSIDVHGPPRATFNPEHFDKLLDKIGPSHDFSDDRKPSMWKHVLGIMDKMEIQMKVRYLEGLTAPGGPGEIKEFGNYAWLQHNMPEISERWAGSIFGRPDRLTPEQWVYVGVLSGNPKDLTDATLDHERFIEVLFNPDFDLANVAESADSAGLETVEVPVEPEPGPIIPNDIEAPYTESDQLRGYRKDVPDEYVREKIDKGERWYLPGSKDTDYFEFVDRPFLFGSNFQYLRVVNGVSMGQDEALALLASEAAQTAAAETSVVPTTVENADDTTWNMDAAQRGNSFEPSVMNDAIAELEREIANHGAPIEGVENIQMPVRAESMAEVTAQLAEINEKFAQAQPGEYIPNQRELAIKLWDGGTFTLETAPQSDSRAINSFRDSISAGSTMSQESDANGFVSKEVWVQPDGEILEYNSRGPGDFGFASY